MGNRFSSPAMGDFYFFSKLPIELQHQILQQAANDWIHQYVDGVDYWATDFGARVFIIDIEVDIRMIRMERERWECVMRFPSLLFVNEESRNIMYDSLLNYKVGPRCGTQKPVPRGEDIHIFFRCFGGGKDFPLSPAIYGFRIQDFRYPGLVKRVTEEKKRLRQMTEELALYTIQFLNPEEQELATRQVDGRGTEGYVRLPLFNRSFGFCKDANGRATYQWYPSILKSETGCWGVRCQGWEELADYSTPPCKEDDTCECSSCVRKKATRKSRVQKGFFGGLLSNYPP